LSRSIRTGEVVRGEEIHVIRGDASPGYIRVNSAPIRDGDGSIVAGVVTYDDVTVEKEQRNVTETLLRISTLISSELDQDALMQKLTHEATRLSRAEFGAFFYNVIDDAGESYMLYTLSGVPRSAFSKFPMPRNTAIFAPTFSGEGVVRIDDVKEDPRYGQNAPYHGMPEGHLPVTSYLAAPVKSRNGEVLGGLFFGHSKAGIFTEADERLLVAISTHAAIAIENARLYEGARRAERRAQQERQRLHELFTHAPVSIYILRGADHVIEFANPVTQRLLKNRDIVGKPLHDVLPNPGESRFDVLDQVLKTGERYVGTEVSTVLDWDGSGEPYEKSFNNVYEPYRDDAGNTVGIMAFAFEVTEQVAARRKVEAMVEELERANRTKDEFLATVSHELRTPLNAMLGWTRMLRSGTVSEDRRERALETIERNAHAQTQLIEDLLDVSRIISGKLRLDVKSVDVHQVVTNAIEAVRPAANAKGVKLAPVLDSTAGPSWGDADRLQQVVWNLLSNGVKFTPKGGRVQVIVKKRDSFAEIAVADNGQGIDPGFLPQVFERFRQADATTTRTHMGLGLGLAIVRHLVELHGGHVKVESEGLGKGARFSVCLPISPLRSTSPDQMPAVRQAASLPTFAYPPELNGVHVLVVEDHDDARELLVQVLEPCKARVSTAANVPDALQLVEQLRPDVILSDIGLPGEDGYAFIKKLRALPADQGGKTPAVALTAYARVEDRTKALVAGFNMHVPKPVDPAELMAVLASLSMMFSRA
jgi:signal transduction histidine kinase